MCLLYIHSEMKSSILCMGNSEDDGSYRLLINLVTDFCLCVVCGFLLKLESRNKA